MEGYMKSLALKVSLRPPSAFTLSPSFKMIPLPFDQKSQSKGRYQAQDSIRELTNFILSLNKARVVLNIVHGEDETTKRLSLTLTLY